jgi:tetratricopeptide (TPR) repeat protein
MSEFVEDSRVEILPDDAPAKPENNMPPEPVIISDDAMTSAKAVKDSGNDLFRAKQYDEAIEMYSQAITLLRGLVPDVEEDVSKNKQENDEEEEEEAAIVELPEPTEEAVLLATCLSNRAACFAALDEWDMVVDDCNWALDIHPLYLKVLVRRAQAYEKVDQVDGALHDMQRIQTLDPTWPKIKESVARLQKIHDEKMEKMKDEAMGKLKDLGNSILGNFGMNLDQFNFQQDPSTGSWSMGNK